MISFPSTRGYADKLTIQFSLNPEIPSRCNIFDLNHFCLIKLSVRAIGLLPEVYKGRNTCHPFQEVHHLQD